MSLTPLSLHSLVEDMVDDLIVDINLQVREHKMDNAQARAFKQDVVKTLGALLEGDAQ